VVRQDDFLHLVLNKINFLDLSNDTMIYNVCDVSNTEDIIGYLDRNGVFSEELLTSSLHNFLFFEFSLADLNLPSADELLAKTLAIKDQVGLQGWISNGKPSSIYRGFSLTYNPNFYDSSRSIYHQTWGSPLLKQNFGRIQGLGDHRLIRNTYYDTYAFRKRLEIVENHLGNLFSHFSCPLLRSRAAFLKSSNSVDKKEGWHVDEPSTHMLRINIPLQTSEEYILEINGNDGYGNSLVLTKHLKVGKIYIWNTRIPHRVTTTKFSTVERIHLVLGLGTWIDYDPINDAFTKSKLYGIPLKTIVEQHLFLKSKT
jgi:hypothetical protein